MDVQRVRVVLFKDHDQVVQHGDVPGGIVGGGNTCLTEKHKQNVTSCKRRPT